MKKQLFALSLAGAVLLAPLSVATAQTSADIVGRYTITKGVNPDGSSYEGKVVVTPDASGGVTVRWDDGSVGLGMIDNGKLYVGMVFEKKSVIVAMTINPDKTLSGKWIQRTQAGNGIEVWKKQP